MPKQEFLFVTLTSQLVRNYQVDDTVRIVLTFQNMEVNEYSTQKFLNTNSPHFQ